DYLTPTAYTSSNTSTGISITASEKVFVQHEDGLNTAVALPEGIYLVSVKVRITIEAGVAPATGSENFHVKLYTNGTPQELDRTVTGTPTEIVTARASETVNTRIVYN